MRIERAQECDLPAVLALIEELLAELGAEGDEFASVDRDRLEACILPNLDSGRFLALLAREDSGTAIGVLTLSESFALYAGGEYGIIDEMYVRPHYRGRGVGRALVETATAVARQRNWFRLDVTGPVDDPDRRVARFYERLGFESTGTKLRVLV